MIYWLVGYALCGGLCYAVGLTRGLKYGQVAIARLIADGWLARGPRWPRTAEEADKLLDALRRDHGG